LAMLWWIACFSVPLQLELFPKYFVVRK